MKKKKRSIASVFLLTVLTALVFLGSTAALLLNFLMTRNAGSHKNSPEAGAVSIVPEKDRSQTVLFIADCGKESHEKLFAVTRFLPAQKKLIILPVPYEASAQVGLKSMSLGEFYRTRGCETAREAAESALNIHIERYARFSKEQFRDFLNLLGGADYSAPFDFEYRNPATGEITAIKKGYQHLDGIMLRQMITYPEFPDGEAFRMKLSGALITTVINKNMSVYSQADIEAMFKQFVNNADTTITAADFSYREDSINYVLDNEDSPAGFLIPEGEYHDDTFIFSKDFKKRLAESFGVEPVVI